MHSILILKGISKRVDRAIKKKLKDILKRDIELALIVSKINDRIIFKEKGELQAKSKIKSSKKKYRSWDRNNQKVTSANEISTRYYTNFRHFLIQVHIQIKTMLQIR